MLQTLEDLIPRLLQDHHDRDALVLAQLLQCQDQLIGDVRIQPRSRLIQQQQRWLCQTHQLTTDVHSLQLTARDVRRLVLVSSDYRICDMLNSQLRQDLVYNNEDVLVGLVRVGQLDECMEGEQFSNGQFSVEDVFLRHIADEVGGEVEGLELPLVAGLEVLDRDIDDSISTLIGG